jgi:tetratricopeptide (TPR) repeat protein
MFLTSVEKRWTKSDADLADDAAARELLRAWREFTSGGATEAGNVVVLSSSGLGGGEVVLDQLRAAVDDDKSVALETECFADGDWNLGVLERLILNERETIAASPELSGVVESYEHVLRVMVPALFPNVDEHAVKSLLFDQLQGRNHGIIETFGFVESLLDEFACFLTDLLTALHQHDGRFPLLVRNLQWIDSYSFNVLASVITRLRHKQAFICLSLVPEAAPDWLSKRLRKLVSDLGLSEIDVKVTPPQEDDVARIVSELDEPARNYCKLIACANWNLTPSELEIAYRNLWGEPPVFTGVEEGSLTINPVWRQTLKRLAGEHKPQIHRALADAALNTTGAETIPAHVAYQLLESSHLAHLVKHSFTLGFHLFEKVGDMDGAINFYQRILALDSHGQPERGRLLAKLANLQFSKGQLQEASAYYDRAIACQTNPFDVALLHYQHALVFCKKLNVFDRASELISGGLAAAQAIPDEDERRYVISRLCNAEALIHYKRGRPDLAMASLEEGDRLLRDISRRPNLASYRFFVSKNTAQVHDRCFHDFDKAISHYQNCLSIARANQQKYNEVLALLLLGRTYAAHNELTKSNECFDEALTLAADKTQFLPVAQLYQFVVRVFAKLNLENLALLWIDKLAAFYSSQHRTYEAVTYLQQKAKQYYDAKLYDEAQWCFESSTALLDRNSDSGANWPQLSLNAHVYLGFIYQMKRNLAQAKDHLQKALALVPNAEQQGGGKNLRGPTERLAWFLNHGDQLRQSVSAGDVK